MAVPPKSVKKAWGALALAALLVAGAIVSNEPVHERIRFDIVSEAFTMPTAVMLYLNRYPAELVSFEGYGFEGIAEAQEIRFNTRQGLHAVTGLRKLTLRAPTNGQPLSYLQCARSGDMGKLTLEVGQGVTIGASGSPGAPPSMTLIAQSSGNFQLVLASQRIEIREAERYEIPEIRADQPFDWLRATLNGNLALLQVEANAGRNAKVRLTFAPSSAELPLLMQPIKLARMALTFTGVLTPSLWLDDKPPSGIVTGQRTDLAIDTDNATIDTIALVATADRADTPTLLIRGSGQARSVRQSSHELLPTRLAQILDQPLSSRTLWLLALGALAALVVKAVDYALGILFEHYIPKG
jgi:hypothetical protein